MCLSDLIGHQVKVPEQHSGSFQHTLTPKHRFVLAAGLISHAFIEVLH